MPKKAKVDAEACIGCGLCIGSHSDIFAFNDEGKAEVVAEGDEAPLGIALRPLVDQQALQPQTVQKRQDAQKVHLPGGAPAVEQNHRGARRDMRQKQAVQQEQINQAAQQITMSRYPISSA